MTHRPPPSTPWISGNCRANGIDIQFLRTRGNKPALLALHGLMGNGACLLPLMQGLDERMDLILPDARGHGGSTSPETGYSYDDLAADVIGLIDGLKLAPPVLVGHSMGGLTATVAACKLGPAIRALVLIDPTFISPERQREVYESGVAQDHQRSLLPTRDEQIEQARTRNPHRSHDLIECLVDARRHTSPNAFAVLTPPNPDWRDLVQRLRAPTLLLTGDRGVVSQDTARELANLNPLLHHEMIADAGHGLPYDKPA